MSDGPHRCLPMHRNWKKVAECADKPAFSSTDIATEVIPALAHDWKSVPTSLLETLKCCFGGDEQKSLLSGASEIEALRPFTAGPSLAGLVIDYAVQAVKKAQSGLDILQSIVENALSEWAYCRGRQIEEHYYRESTGRRAANVRSRIENGIGQSAIASLTSQLLGNEYSLSVRRSSKKDGLDDGPAIYD